MGGNNLYQYENSSRYSSSYAIKIRSKSQIDDTWLWKNGCSQRGEKRDERGRKAKGERGADAVVEKKLSARERRRDAQTREREREEEGPNTTRKKADTADVAGERNAAGTSGRKLGGRVRRRGSGARGKTDARYRKRERERGRGRRWGSVGRARRGRGGVLPAFKTSRQSTDPL